MTKVLAAIRRLSGGGSRAASAPVAATTPKRSADRAAGGPVRAIWNGAVLAESERTVLVERRHYFPPEDVDFSHLEPSDRHTTCHWKGVASYYDVVVNGERNSAAAWYYPDPSPAASKVKGRVAFWKGVEVIPTPGGLGALDADLIGMLVLLRRQPERRRRRSDLPRDRPLGANPARDVRVPAPAGPAQTAARARYLAPERPAESGSGSLSEPRT
jgi:uncharacterized protein (DUF427 family)